MTGNVESAMGLRYARALQRSAPKFAAETPGLAVEGYWLDERRFFFTSERVEPALGQLVATPCIADAETQRVEEIISLENLARLLSDYSYRRIDLTALSSAQFDMPDRATLGVSVAGVEYLIDARTLRVQQSWRSLDVPALYSPDGRHACVVRGHDLGLVHRVSGEERALTGDGSAHRCYGQESESNLAVISYRQRPYPVGLWSPDSQWLLTHCIDERELPELSLLQHAPPGGGRPVLHSYKYPFSGDPMPMATFVAIHIDSGRIIKFDSVPAPVLAYSPFSMYRTAWFAGRDTAWFIRVDRYSKTVELVRLDLAQGSARVVLSEAAERGYIELHQSMIGKPNVRTLTGSDEVIWFSERDGWGHLYLYDATTGACKNRITSGEWMVRDIVHVDERQRKILFTASGVDARVDPARRSVCSIGFDGKGFEVLLSHDGDISVPKTEQAGGSQTRSHRPAYARIGVSPNERFCAAHFGSIERGLVTQIVDLHTKRVVPIASIVPDSSRPTPRPFAALAADGVTRVHGTLFFPSDFDASRRYPLIDYIYPGPHVPHQPQFHGATKALFAQALAEVGFVTMTLDSRAQPFRSRALHQIGYGDLLEPQLADHAAVVRQLCERYAFIDGDRVGMVGYSAGGAATARALFEYGHVFKVGVSVCGNHDHASNAAMFSDKYQGPDGREAWAAQANSHSAHKLSGKLLLISGDMDDNAHISHTFVLINALVRANRDFDLLIMPNEGHDLLVTNGYVQRRVWDYFVRNLREETPPRDFRVEFTEYELARQDRNWNWELAL